MKSSLQNAFSFVYHNLSPVNPSGVVELNDYLRYTNIKAVRHVTAQYAVLLVERNLAEDMSAFCLIADDDDSIFDGPMLGIERLIQDGVVDETVPMSLITFDRNGKEVTDLVLGSSKEILSQIRDVNNKIKEYDSKFPVWAKQRRNFPITNSYDL